MFAMMHYQPTDTVPEEKLSVNSPRSRLPPMVSRSLAPEIGASEKSRREFSRLEDVPEETWLECFRLVRGQARRMLEAASCKSVDAEAIACQLIMSVRQGERAWDCENNPHLLHFLYRECGIIVCSQIATRQSRDGKERYVSKYSDRRDRTRRDRGRGSGILRKIASEMDVPKVIENLPMVALLVSRLNDLLNPVANPDSDWAEDDKVTVTPKGRQVLSDAKAGEVNAP